VVVPHEYHNYLMKAGIRENTTRIDGSTTHELLCSPMNRTLLEHRLI
jgi:hypothetical protein